MQGWVLYGYEEVGWGGCNGKRSRFHARDLAYTLHSTPLNLASLQYQSYATLTQSMFAPRNLIAYRRPPVFPFCCTTTKVGSVIGLIQKYLLN